MFYINSFVCVCVCVCTAVLPISRMALQRGPSDTAKPGLHGARIRADHDLWYCQRHVLPWTSHLRCLRQGQASVWVPRGAVSFQKQCRGGEGYLLPSKLHRSSCKFFRVQLWCVVAVKEGGVHLMVLSVNSTAEDWILKTQAPHVHKILYWRILCMPLGYITHDSGTLPAGLSESPEPESRNLACWHIGEGEDLRPSGEPSADGGISPSYQKSCLSIWQRRRFSGVGYIA